MEERLIKIIQLEKLPVVLVELYMKWIYEYKEGSLVEVHINETDLDDLDNWLMENYPGCEELESFFIEVD